jgi:hypothetical protein
MTRIPENELCLGRGKNMCQTPKPRKLLIRLGKKDSNGVPSVLRLLQLKIIRLRNRLHREQTTIIKKKKEKMDNSSSNTFDPLNALIANDLRIQQLKKIALVAPQLPAPDRVNVNFKTRQKNASSLSPITALNSKAKGLNSTRAQERTTQKMMKIKLRATRTKARVIVGN